MNCQVSLQGTLIYVTLPIMTNIINQLQSVNSVLDHCNLVFHFFPKELWFIPYKNALIETKLCHAISCSNLF